MRTIVTASLLVWTSVHEFGQPVPASPAFEVASIKPNNSGSGRASSHVSNGEVILRNVPLRDCIEMAYQVNDARISGPDWLATERFDIVAKPRAGYPHDHEQYRPMLQALLADRFKLVIHHESKMLSAFALVVSKMGPKLEKGDPGGAHVNGGNTHITGTGMSIVELADNLTGKVDRPVVDKTGLEGVYNLQLEWAPEEKGGEPAAKPDAPPGPSLFTAIQEQLGLRLDSQKLPVDIVVVDRVEKVPTEN
jgi:uncharacterized protein (TIGR03435 family)